MTHLSPVAMFCIVSLLPDKYALCVTCIELSPLKLVTVNPVNHENGVLEVMFEGI